MDAGALHPLELGADLGQIVEEERGGVMNRDGGGERGRRGLDVVVDGPDRVEHATDGGDGAVLAVKRDGLADDGALLPGAPGRVPQVERKRPGEDGQPGVGDLVDLPAFREAQLGMTQSFNPG